MNRQKSDQYFSHVMAFDAIVEAFPDAGVSTFLYAWHYYAWPVTFGNTGGPFALPGMIYGQAMTTYTIEAWVDGKYAALTCNGKLIKAIDDWAGTESVRLR